MSSRNIAAIHDRIDELLFEHRLHASSITALQRRVILLEAAVRELRVDSFGAQAGHLLQRDPAPEVPPLRHAHTRPGGRAHAHGLA